MRFRQRHVTLAQVKANCKPSTFAYPAPVTEESSATVAKVPTAVLSTTARVRDRAKRRAEKPAVKRSRPPTPGGGESSATGPPGVPTAGAGTTGDKPGLSARQQPWQAMGLRRLHASARPLGGHRQVMLHGSRGHASPESVSLSPSRTFAKAL